MKRLKPELKTITKKPKGGRANPNESCNYVFYYLKQQNSFKMFTMTYDFITAKQKKLTKTIIEIPYNVQHAKHIYMYITMQCTNNSEVILQRSFEV